MQAVLRLSDEFGEKFFFPAAEIELARQDLESALLLRTSHLFVTESRNQCSQFPVP